MGEKKRNPRGAGRKPEFVTYSIAYNNLPGDCETRFENVLYRNRKGAFVLHEHYTEKYVKGGKPVTKDAVREMTAQQALEWVSWNGAVILDEVGLELPDEI